MMRASSLRFAPSSLAALLALAWLGSAAPATASAREVLGGHEGWLDRMGAGIRELGMGNTGTSSEAAMPAAYWNPAVLPFDREVTVGAGADMRTLQRNGGYAGLQGRVAANLGAGIGLANRGDYEVNAYDRDETPIGTARPQFLGSYLGLGLKTSRSNAFGAALQWYSSNLDLSDGTGNVNVIGIFNLGWYKRWGANLKTGVVARNLGINADLSADFEQTTLSGEETQGFERTAGDFMPKTLVAAATYTKRAWGKEFDFALEVLDYQLKNALFVTDANFHVQDFRLGTECRFTDQIAARGGYDQGNFSAGFGYTLPLGKRKLMIDYAVLSEKGLLNFNYTAVGLRFTL